MKKWKTAFVMVSLLFTSSAFASGVCLVSYTDNVRVDEDGKYVSQIYVRCNNGNADTKDYTVAPDHQVTNVDLATVLNNLVAKGYKVISQNKDQWTLVKE